MQPIALTLANQITTLMGNPLKSWVQESPNLDLDQALDFLATNPKYGLFIVYTEDSFPGKSLEQRTFFTDSQLKRGTPLSNHMQYQNLNPNWDIDYCWVGIHKRHLKRKR